MQSEMDAIAQAFLGPLSSSIGGVEAMIMPLLDALMVFVISAAALSASVRRQDVVGVGWHVIFIIGTAQLAIRYWPELLDWSIQTAGDLTQLGGAGRVATPFEIATAGAALFTRAADHADVLSSYLNPLSWLLGIFLVLIGIGMFISYLIISAISLSAFVEFYAAGIVLAPLIAFLPVVGFTGAGFTPISFIMSATLRIAALGFIASFGTTLVSEHALPPIGEPVTWLQGLIALGLALALLYIAWRANSLISGILLGRPGWSGAGLVTGAIVHAGGMLMSGGAGAAAGAAARSGGGGSHAGSSGGGGGGGGGVTARTTPVNSRTTAAGQRP